jgi:hypothetical protein
MNSREARELHARQAAPEQRFRTLPEADVYLGKLSDAGQLIEAHEANAQSAVAVRYYFVTLNGALIGRGLTLDDAVADAESALRRSESAFPSLF